MAKPLRMHQIKRIIELYQQGQSIRQTKRLTGYHERQSGIIIVGGVNAPNRLIYRVFSGILCIIKK